MSKPLPKKGSPYWHYDFVIDGRRFHGSTGLTGKREARAYIDRLRHQIMLPAVSRPPITLDQACGLYQDHAELLDSWPTTRYILQAMVDGMDKDRLLSELTQRDLIAFVAQRRKGRSNSSVNRELDTVRAVWNRARKARYDVGEMPDWGALRLKTVRRTHRLLSGIEEPSLMGELRDDVRPAVDFLLMSGWRRAEVLGLGWADLDLAAMTAVTRIKGGDMVTRPLTSEMVALIANQPRGHAHVFTYVCRKTSLPDRVKGRRYPLSVTVLRGAWAAAQAEAELSRPIRIHDLRHTRATRMLRNTGNLGAVREALKHRSIKTTLQYTHVNDQDVRTALSAPDAGPTSIDAAESRNIPEVQPKKRA